MAITIQDDFLQEIKQHLRVFHSEDDGLIKNEIQVSINNIYEILKLETTLPKDSKDLSENVKLAVKHYVAMLRSNPDERIETRFIATNKRLIEKILGSERSYKDIY